MAANVTILPALRDALLAAGIGALLAFAYRLLRLVLGGRGAGCALCDVLISAAAAVLYKSAVHSVFNYPTARIYTLLPMLCGYFAVLNTVLLPIQNVEKAIHNRKNSKKHKKSHKKDAAPIAK